MTEQATARPAGEVFDRTANPKPLEAQIKYPPGSMVYVLKLVSGSAKALCPACEGDKKVTMKDGETYNCPCCKGDGIANVSLKAMTVKGYGRVEKVQFTVARKNSDNKGITYDVFMKTDLMKDKSLEEGLAAMEQYVYPNTAIIADTNNYEAMLVRGSREEVEELIEKHNRRTWDKFKSLQLEEDPTFSDEFKATIMHSVAADAALVIEKKE